MTVWKAFVAAWSSRKLWAFLLTAGLLWAGLERVVAHIYEMDAEKLPFLVQIASIVFGGIVCAAGAYMGFSTWTARFNADSVASVLTKNISVRAPKSTYFDDLDD